MPGSVVIAPPARRRAELVRRRERRWREEPGSEPVGGGGPRQRTTRRILVVDDEVALRTLCRVNLTASGMEVLEAGDGHRALELATAEQLDLVVLDVMMPGPDGWEVAERLAADERTRDLPVIFLTARGEAADRERGRELGAVGYVTKPFDPVGLAALIERTLERIAAGEREQLSAEITGEG
jgi:two-component system phosphate regulon response regulator PhoB